MSNLFSNWFARVRSSRPDIRRVANRFRPQLETLEDRRVLSSTASISGHVLVDPTGNGLFQNAVAQSNVKVILYADSHQNGVLDGSDTQIASQFSAADGSYAFNNLPAGTYFVKDTVPSGFVRLAPTTATYFTVSLADGQGLTGEDFVNFHKLNTSVVTNISYTVTTPAGVSTTVTNLRGTTVQGDTVAVNFTIAAGAAPTLVSFATYDAPGASFNAGNATQQVLVADATGTFGPGTYSLALMVPADFYQIDFVVGDAIQQFGPAGSNLFYSAEGRLLSADNGGNVAHAASSLSGTVLDSTGMGLQNVAVTLAGTNDLGQTVTETVFTNSTGNYTFTDLRSGTYTITVTPITNYVVETGTSGEYSAITVGNGTAGTGYDFALVLTTGGSPT